MISDLEVTRSSFSCTAELNLDGPYEKSSPWEFRISGDYDIPDEDIVEWDNIVVEVMYEDLSMEVTKVEGDVTDAIEKDLNRKIYGRWNELMEQDNECDCPILDDGWPC